MDSQLKKIIMIETIAFFVGWVIIFILGSDFPPPIGFYKVVLLVAILDIIQYFYLKYLLRDISEKPTFVKNCLFFIFGGLLVAVLTSLPVEYELEIQRYIWIFVVSSVSFIYGTFLWVVNKIIKDRIIKK